METDKRPWLGIHLSLDKIKLTDWNNSKGITAFLDIEVKNYGGSPAVNALVMAEMGEHPFYTDKKGMERLDINQAESCARTAARAIENPIGRIPGIPR